MRKIKQKYVKREKYAKRKTKVTKNGKLTNTKEIKVIDQRKRGEGRLKVNSTRNPTLYS